MNNIDGGGFCEYHILLEFGILLLHMVGRSPLLVDFKKLQLLVISISKLKLNRTINSEKIYFTKILKISDQLILFPIS